MAGFRGALTQLRSRAGFTFIELMVVVVVLGLVMAVALPSVGKSVNTDRVNRSVLVVQSMLAEAGQLAARRNEPVTVTLSSGVLSINQRSTGTALKQRSFGPTSDLRATLAISPATGVTIFPNGRSSAAISVTLTGGNASATVTRSTTGVIRRQ